MYLDLFQALKKRQTNSREPIIPPQPDFLFPAALLKTAPTLDLTSDEASSLGSTWKLGSSGAGRGLPAILTREACDGTGQSKYLGGEKGLAQ